MIRRYLGADNRFCGRGVDSVALQIGKTHPLDALRASLVVTL